MASIIARIAGMFRRRPRASTPAAPAPRAGAPAKAPASRVGAPAKAPASRPPRTPAGMPTPATVRQSAVPPRGRHLEYNPSLDGHADPGEIVWTWVQFEDDPSQGK